MASANTQIGKVQSGARVVSCGGRDIFGDITFTCYYMERDDEKLRFGGAPQVDGTRAGACYVSDEHLMAFVGG